MTAISNPEALKEYLVGKNLFPAGAELHVTYCDGGVSGVVALVGDGDRLLLVKQALAQLKVAALWECDTRRIAVEHRALEVYARIVPDCVPRPLYYDEESAIMVREAAPENSRSWKQALLAGVIDPAVADKATDALAAVHNQTAVDVAVREAFQDDAFFNELRIKPYIRYTVEKHPRLAAQAEEIIAVLRREKIALIHGDYSPKNILLGERGRLYILDFEVACYAHPAFDLAFFLNHFLLKAVRNKTLAASYLAVAERVAERYLAGQTCLPRDRMEAVTAQTLGFLFLARVDGKSPAEYITREADKALVRRASLRMLDEAARTPDQAIRILREEIDKSEVCP